MVDGWYHEVGEISTNIAIIVAIVKKLWYPRNNAGEHNMSSSNRPKRRMGRPPTSGKGVQIQVRCHANFLKALDEWRKKQEGGPLTRPEAIRQLTWLALLQRGAGGGSA
jgi:hypothetical protein